MLRETKSFVLSVRTDGNTGGVERKQETLTQNSSLGSNCNSLSSRKILKIQKSDFQKWDLYQTWTHLFYKKQDSHTLFSISFTKEMLYLGFLCHQQPLAFFLLLLKIPQIPNAVYKVLLLLTESQCSFMSLRKTKSRSEATHDMPTWREAQI